MTPARATKTSTTSQAGNMRKPMSRASTTRKTLPLTEADRHDLALIRRSPEYRDVLRELSGSDIGSASSEAAVLHAVVEAGLRATREQVEARGYAAMAAERGAVTERRRVARRRRPEWADE